MNWLNNPFAQLAVRVRQGEDSAAEQFRRTLTPPLKRMVRRVANYGACPSAWDQKILAETETVMAASHGLWERDSEQVIGQVADRLCQELVDHLSQQWQAKDTWSAAVETSRLAGVLT
jgi:hypothetical protein